MSSSENDSDKDKNGKSPNVAVVAAAAAAEEVVVEREPSPEVPRRRYYDRIREAIKSDEESPISDDEQGPDDNG